MSDPLLCDVCEVADRLNKRADDLQKQVLNLNVVVCDQQKYRQLLEARVATIETAIKEHTHDGLWKNIHELKDDLNATKIKLSDPLLCDVCDKEPATHRGVCYGIETNYCDKCAGDPAPRESAPETTIPADVEAEFVRQLDHLDKLGACLARPPLASWARKMLLYHLRGAYQQGEIAGLGKASALIAAALI